ncbi:hypothetical protein [Stackebrandtia nassauensis]|uniref:hypothetical protein n=1 Tax=Stackebrandtia nassauensis TaxID=283811 RepID=UPI0001A3A74F|nr:hypothetical protein [Stackebrandtia nassauensis]
MGRGDVLPGGRRRLRSPPGRRPGVLRVRGDTELDYHTGDGDGATIGGWYADRAQWKDLEGQLPDGEDERYPRGDSTHTLPIWLPPDLKPAQVSLYLWARPD